MDRLDAALLLARLVVGLTLLAHGLNHAFGGGKLPGAARWFGSLGLRPPMMHAVFSAVFEVLGGAGLALGFLTPLAAAAAVGTMSVAIIVAHRKNGFWNVKDGFEYPLMLATVAVVVAIAGPGVASVDHGLDTVITGWLGAGIAVVGGLGGTALLLGTSWRPGSIAKAGA